MPFSLAGDGVRVALRVSPRASRNGIAGVAGGPDGPRLKVAVTAAPEGGKANAAVLKLLAKAWRLPKSRLEVVTGAADRNKVVLIHGGDAALRDRLSRETTTT
jgi:uncharacterized protein (TIGR00251 family)